MKPRYLLLLLGLALAGTLLLGSAGVEIEVAERPAAGAQWRGLAALARVLLGNAS